MFGYGDVGWGMDGRCLFEEIVRSAKTEEYGFVVENEMVGAISVV